MQWQCLEALRHSLFALMNAIITTVLPVFGLIVVGYILAKANIIDGVAGRGITLFVFNVAIPAFLFRTVASMEAQDGAPWALWIAFFGGLALAWILAAIVSRFISSLNVSGGATRLHGRGLWQSGAAWNTLGTGAFRPRRLPCRWA